MEDQEAVQQLDLMIGSPQGGSNEIEPASTISENCS